MTVSALCFGQIISPNRSNNFKIIMSFGPDLSSSHHPHQIKFQNFLCFSMWRRGYKGFHYSEWVWSLLITCYDEPITLVGILGFFLQATYFFVGRLWPFCSLFPLSKIKSFPKNFIFDSFLKLVSLMHENETLSPVVRWGDRRDLFSKQD